MNSKRSIDRILIVLIFSYLSACPTFSQPFRRDSLFINGTSTISPAVRSLKIRLEQNVDGTSIQLTDSLLQVARQLSYQPGQVVALCELAGIHFQQQQTQQAEALLKEAQIAAGNAPDLTEAGWALQMLGFIQKQHRRNSVAFAPVFMALGKTMTSVAHRERRDTKLNRRNGNESAREANRMEMSIPIPAIPVEPLRLGRHFPSEEFVKSSIRTNIHFTDRWLDSLINGRAKKSSTVQQLTAQKKIRDSSQQLSKAFAQKGDYAKAYNYFLQYTAYKDSLAAEVTARQVALLQYKQNTQKKENQIKLLTSERQLREQEAEQQKLLLLILAGLAIPLLGLSVVLIRTNRQRRVANRQLHDQKVALEETVSELKATQNQLIQSEKMAALGELTAGIAHEIQNPLNFVNNFSEVSTELVDELAEEQERAEPDHALQAELLADLKQNLGKITHHGGRASAIVKGMLEHSRSISGEKESSDLNSLVTEYQLLAYHAIRSKDPSFDARLTTHLAPDLGLVKIVPQEIGRVLLNLFGNAYYALQKKRLGSDPNYKPELIVSTNRVGNQLLLMIKDNGTGIPLAIKQKVFQPFFTTKPNGEGTGLGLSLSYDIITKGYGGNIVVETDGASFTEFTVSLPTSVSVNEA
ncbi:hypothetical protein BH09BAC4_BH09BAC4_28520 [soil metagenome]